MKITRKIKGLIDAIVSLFKPFDIEAYHDMERGKKTT